MPRRAQTEQARSSALWTIRVSAPYRSYPVVKDGLIYVVDVRNGLYVLRYEGPYAAELRVEFLEGNSNLSG